MKQDHYFSGQQEEEVDKALGQIKEICIQNKWTLAAAESVSCGFLQTLLGSEPEAGLFLEGGLTIYNCQQKTKQLQIPEDICNPCDGISPGMAELLAKNITRKFNCKLGISLTGYAAPIADKGIRQLFAYGAITLEDTLIGCKIFLAKNEDPDRVRKFYAESMVIECARILRSINEKKGNETIEEKNSG